MQGASMGGHGGTGAPDLHRPGVPSPSPYGPGELYDPATACAFMHDQRRAMLKPKIPASRVPYRARADRPWASIAQCKSSIL